MAPVCAVVVAGGSGQRFGNPGGKQLVNVAGRPLMSWSIRAFDRSDKVGHIVVVCPAERRARCAAWPSTRLTMTRHQFCRCRRYPPGLHPCRRACGTGGFRICRHPRRRPSAHHDRGHRSCDRRACGRPLARRRRVRPAAIDTLKIVDGDNIVETPPRELYWAAQTPQIFSVDAMKRAHTAAITEGFIGTDDSSLVERMRPRPLCPEPAR